MDAYLDLLTAAAGELRARGIEQWDPDAALEIRSEVELLLAEGALISRRDGGELIGACILTRHVPACWNGPPAPAAYVHRLVVRTDRRGRGLGGELLRACAETATAWSCSRLRLDCWEGNLRLRAYYAAQGFTPLAAVPERDFFVRLFERNLP
jgi:GNAT superfamily N-acetyltransferase